MQYALSVPEVRLKVVNIIDDPAHAARDAAARLLLAVHMHGALKQLLH